MKFQYAFQNFFWTLVQELRHNLFVCARRDLSQDVLLTFLRFTFSQILIRNTGQEYAISTIRSSKASILSLDEQRGCIGCFQRYCEVFLSYTEGAAKYCGSKLHLRTFACGSLSFRKKYIFVLYSLVFIAKCRNIVKWCCGSY